MIMGIMFTASKCAPGVRCLDFVPAKSCILRWTITTPVDSGRNPGFFQLLTLQLRGIRQKFFCCKISKENEDGAKAFIGVLSMEAIWEEIRTSETLSYYIPGLQWMIQSVGRDLRNRGIHPAGIGIDA